jgi:hypothetical protein
MRLPQEPLYDLTTKYFLNFNKNNNIYCIAVVKLEKPGYTSICGLEPHRKMQEMSWQQRSIPKWDSNLKSFVAGRSLMVQNTKNDPDMP